MVDPHDAGDGSIRRTQCASGPPLSAQEQHRRDLEIVDLEARDTQDGALVNRLLRAVFAEIKVNADRSVLPTPPVQSCHGQIPAQ